jgi:predicted CoA-binding protein
LLREIMLKENVWAVIGASQDRKKFSNKIYRRLKDRGYIVYAVNPNLETVESDPCYPNLESLPEIPRVINMVVSPANGQAVLRKAAELGIKMIWFQPGSWNQQIEQLGQQLGLTMLQDCVLVATDQRQPNA